MNNNPIKKDFVEISKSLFLEGLWASATAFQIFNEQSKSIKQWSKQSFIV